MPCGWALLLTITVLQSSPSVLSKAFDHQPHVNTDTCSTNMDVEMQLQDPEQICVHPFFQTEATEGDFSYTLYLWIQGLSLPGYAINPAAEQPLKGKMRPSVPYAQTSSFLYSKWPKDQLYMEVLLQPDGLVFAWRWISILGTVIFWKVFLILLDARNTSEGNLISWTSRCRLAKDLVGIPGLILEVLMWPLCWLFALDLENGVGLRSMTRYSSSGLLKGMWRNLLTVPQFPLYIATSFRSCFLLSRLKKIKLKRRKFLIYEFFFKKEN